MEITPVLRWAGGKSQILKQLSTNFPQDFNYIKNRFYEPFIGGGALSWSLAAKLPSKNLYINDINGDLINLYLTIKDQPNELISELKKLKKDTSKERYYEIRTLKPSKHNYINAARFIYLNKTSFNGIHRVNSKGEFNVPYGNIKEPKIFDEDNIHALSIYLKEAKIRNQSYISALSDARKGDLVYLDPPYIPLNTTSSFSKYAKDDFLELDQYGLRGCIEGLNKRGVNILFSNSSSPLVKDIFGDILDLRTITLQRNIGASVESRGKIKETLGVNYDISNLPLGSHEKL